MSKGEEPLEGKTTRRIPLNKPIPRLLIVLLSVTTLLLAIENKNLKDQISHIYQPGETLKQGDTLGAVSVLTLQDSVYEIEPNSSARAMILVLFSTTCPACENSIASLNNIERQAHINNVEVLFISIHGKQKTVGFLQRHNLDWSVYLGPDSVSRNQLKARAVPQTILVSPQGVVWNNWLGFIDSVKEAQIVAYMKERIGV